MGRKIATIGITINLENYENLRLEVQGEIGPEGTTEDLIQFLDGMLARLGHGDQATGELVDAYRRRVLAMPGTGEAHAPSRAVAPAAPAPAPAPVPRPAAGPVPEGAPGAEEPAPQAGARQEAQAPRDEKPATVRVSAGGRAGKAAPMAQAPAPKKGPAPVPAGEAPGEPVTPKEPAPKAEKPVIIEGDVACQGCGASITKNQEKLSRLLTGKSLCKRCMNP